ncbi:MAG TPA: hypothetical protein PKD11_02510 [Pyrinomonadaceae bacterium]|nr:hypothetical protein [Pyrinomonadaceae bacterium]
MKCVYHSGRDIMKLLVPAIIVFAVVALVISIVAGQDFLFKSAGEMTPQQDSKQIVSVQPTPPEKVENTEQTDVGSLLNSRTEFLIKEKEPEWKLVLDRSSSRSETSFRRWKYKEKEIDISINAYTSAEQARSSFEKSKDIEYISAGIEGKDMSEFGDNGSYLRPRDKKGARSSLTFSIGRFHVHIFGETASVLRFAKHISEALRAHR